MSGERSFVSLGADAVLPSFFTFFSSGVDSCRRVVKTVGNQEGERRMDISSFIEENRDKITRGINSVMFRHDGNGGRGTIPDPAPQYDDDELELWIANDEGLYNWAIESGVDI